MVEIEWAGESLVLLPGRALWWARRRTLCVADMHLGKSAAFRRAGVPVPDATTASDLARLGELISAHGPDRLVILGDLLHARTGRSPETLGVFAQWRSAHAALDVLLIRGNHDTRAGDPPEDWGIRCADEPYADPGDGDLCFAHYPEAGAADRLGRHALAGHLHPAVRLEGATTGVRAVCFWFGPCVAVLPAFGSFTGSAAVRPAPGDRVFALGDGEIAEVATPPRARRIPSRA